MTPAVLRLPDGSGSRGTLKTISVTGGLLDVSSTLDRGSRVKVMFMTPTGPVLGAAEMLKPLSTTQQPFRFVSLEQDAQRKLQAIVESRLNPPEAWIEKYRAGLTQRKPQRRALKYVLGAIAAAALAFASAIYFLHIPLFK
jgi:hypothetical protein